MLKYGICLVKIKKKLKAIIKHLPESAKVSTIFVICDFFLNKKKLYFGNVPAMLPLGATQSVGVSGNKKKIVSASVLQILDWWV